MAEGVRLPGPHEGGGGAWLSSPTRTTRCSTNLASRSRRRSGVEPDAARGADHRRLRGDSAVRRAAWPRAAARRGPRHFRAALCRAARPAARARRVPRRCLSRSIIRGCWPARRRCRVGSADELDDDELAGAARGATRGAGRHHRTAPRPLGRREAGRRGDRQPAEVRGFRTVQAAVRAGAEGPRQPALRQTSHGSSCKAEIKPGSSSFSAARKPMSPRSGSRSQTPNGDTDARLRVIFATAPRATAAAVAAARALQGRGRPADHRAHRRAAVRRPDAKTATSKRHDLCAAEQIRSSDRRGAP